MMHYWQCNVAVLLFLFLSKQMTFARKQTNDVNIKVYREKVERMFYHAYEGYLKYAYPYDELKPLTCKGHDTWGSYSLTLIDAMDTLAVMGNYSEFRRIANLVIDKGENAFDMDINVSVFETNIRIVGGLISAHLLMKRAGMELEAAWPCSGPLLRMADSIARKLLPAFDTPTGMPYGTVNLQNGVPKGETPITCTAGVGTFLVEFGTLSRLTGDPIFEKVAVRAIRALWKYRSPIGLLGNHVDVKTGKWTASDSGIGGGVDSYFEYLVKGSILFNLPEMARLFREFEVSIKKYLKKDDWYMWAQMNKGTITLPMFTSLDAFWPNIQMMLGDIDAAMKTLHNFHMVWRQFGFTPEYYNIPKSEVHKGREAYPLRPELIESIMYLYRATKDPALLEMGVDIVESIERQARTSCGYATIKDVRDHRLEDRMESFFLAETTKYLYLLFDEDNFIHNNGSKGEVINTPSGSCVIEAGGYVFTTEAHPIDLAAVHCCSAKKLEEDEILEDFHSNLDLLSLFNLVDDDDSDLGMTNWAKKKRKKNTFHEERKDESGTVEDESSDSEDENNKEVGDTNGENVRNSDARLEEDKKLKDEKEEMLSPAGPPAFEDEVDSFVTEKSSLDLTETEMSLIKILMESLSIDVNHMKKSDITEKLLSEFKGTAFENTAVLLAKQLLLKEMKSDKRTEEGKESQAEIGVALSEEDGDDDKNTELFKNLLLELKEEILKEKDASFDEVTSPEENLDDISDGVSNENEEQYDESGQNENDEGEELSVGDDIVEKTKESNSDESTEDESTSAAENLRHHLETETQEGEKEDLTSQTDMKTSYLENKRANLLSMTKKILQLFASISNGKLDNLNGENENTNSFSDSSPSIGNLYASLAKQPLRYFDDPHSMHCPAQPFHSRLSVYGEFFVDE